MPLTKLQAKENLSRLVEKYQKVVAQGRVNEYNEEATKTAFIQPLLKDVLGWDVNNFDEVSPEEQISRGRVDYCLKISGKPKMFVEAKPLKADISKHIEQAVRYGYNRKGVPFVMLTDFEGIKLFDVTIKPDSKNPNKGLKLNLFWNFYETNFSSLWQLSKESVINGELDKLLLAKPKDRVPVDKAILDDLENWRESLAKDIFKNNPKLFHSTPDMSLRGSDTTEAISNLSKREIATPSARKDTSEHNADYLKEITQRILDRIIFMRFCEDREFVHGQTLRELFEERTEQVGTNTMLFLAPKFRQFDITFDSDLFSHKEWEDNLQIDFKVMNKIVLDTYNPYQFDVIPLEVLGNIYEQYLGYTIRLTPQMVKYELKPEVRKAGGVYYTPEYIVDYIVKNTVGKLLKESTSDSFLSLRTRSVAEQSDTTKAKRRGNLTSLNIKKLRILDPACGSGSFLIRAYEEMLNYYRELKKKNSKTKQSFDVVPAKAGNQKVLDSRLHGNDNTVQSELDLKHSDIEIRLTIQEKAEILKNHIFGVDIDEQAVEVTKLSLMLKMLEGEFGIIPGRNILPMLDKNIRCGNSLISGSPIELKKYFGDDYYKVKPFNWEEEFKEVFADGIASPKTKSTAGGFDVVIGNPPYVDVRKMEENDKKYAFDVFSTANNRINTFGLFIEKGLSSLNSHGYLGFIIPNTFLTHSSYGKLRESVLNTCRIKKIVNFENRVFTQATVETVIIILQLEKTEKIRTKNRVLIYKDTIESDPKEIEQDIFNESLYSAFLLESNKNNIALLNKIENMNQPLIQIADAHNGINPGNATDEYIVNKKIDKRYKKVIDGANIKRYIIVPSGMFILYDRELLERARNEQIFLHSPKIIMQKIGKNLVAAYDNEQWYTLINTTVIIPKKEEYNLSFLLALLNSKLLNYYYRIKYLGVQIKGEYLKQLPIKAIDFNNKQDKKLHDNLVALVDVMLDLNKKIQTAKGNAKEQIQKQIDSTDRQIDDIVYKLYNITDDERKIIERN